MSESKANKITIIKKYPQRVEDYIKDEMAICGEGNAVRKMALEELLAMGFKAEMTQAYASKLVFPIFEKVREKHPEVVQKDYKQVVNVVIDVVKKIEEKPKFKIGKTIEPIRKVIVRIMKNGQEEKEITVSRK